MAAEERDEAPSWGSTPPSRGLRAAGGQGALSIVGAVVGLVTLTVGQPLLGVLADSPEFFVAKRMSAVEIVLFAILVVFIPVVVGLAIALLKPVNHSLVGAVLSLTLGFFVTLLASNVFNRLEIESGNAIIGSIVAGLVFVVLYLTIREVRNIVRLLWVVAPLVVAWFLVMTPAASLVFGDSPQQVRYLTRTTNDYPVVLLVFDEFPLATIMDGSGDLVADQFPGFARLAEDGVWYRNALTTADRTNKAVPAILSGRRTPTGPAPTFNDHPNSVFTALSRVYDVSAVETITSMCPTDICREAPSSMTDAELWRSLWLDSAVVLGHQNLPVSMDDSLPSLDTAWQGFGGGSAGDASEWNIHEVLEPEIEVRQESVASFHEAVSEAPNSRSFVFGHLILPHLPWHFLADGSFITREGYGPASIKSPASWVDNEWQVAQAMQRHVHMAQYSDSVISDMVDDLVAAERYEQSMVVVVADHGVSFLSGPDRRGISPETLGWVGAVPMFVKYPEGLEASPPAGTVSDAPVMTMDVVPTILDTIGASPSYPMDGTSMLGSINRTERRVDGVEDRSFVFAIDGRERYQAAAYMDDLLPGRRPWGLFPNQKAAQAMGTRPTVTDAPEVELGLDNPGRFVDVDPTGPLVPSVVTGTIRGADAGELVAILMRGEVVAVTESYLGESGAVRFYGLVHPDAIPSGDTEVEPVIMNGNGTMVR
ncbi:MAG: sulfatase-like hydrolase/transferase [Acidimicrobiia bacterium]|nr:sulfatase-like hydrolase/transferase [Acidimicrobiia bacterium]